MKVPTKGITLIGLIIALALIKNRYNERETTKLTHSAHDKIKEVLRYYTIWTKRDLDVGEKTYMIILSEQLEFIVPRVDTWEQEAIRSGVVYAQLMTLPRAIRVAR